MNGPFKVSFQDIFIKFVVIFLYSRVPPTLAKTNGVQYNHISYISQAKIDVLHFSEGRSMNFGCNNFFNSGLVAGNDFKTV